MKTNLAAVLFYNEFLLDIFGNQNNLSLPKFLTLSTAGGNFENFLSSDAS